MLKIQMKNILTIIVRLSIQKIKYFNMISILKSFLKFSMKEEVKKRKKQKIL
jgi:hypothetical protein